jgi:hypothetical protein
MLTQRARPGPNSDSDSASWECVGVGGCAVRTREARSIARFLVCGTPKSAALRIPYQTENPHPRRTAAYCFHKGSTCGTSSMATQSGSPTVFRAYR